MEIGGQLRAWNIQTGQNGIVTCSQGGFRLKTGEIRAPDVAFTPKNIFRNLTHEQSSSFQGPPFSPTLVVEVDDMEDTNSAKFHKLDSKFKDSYFALGTSVKLGWLIDPIYDQIWVYKRTNINNVCHRYKYKWKNLDGDSFIYFVIQLQEPSESSEDENLHHFCPYCSQTFNNGYLLIEHMEDDHLRKKRN
ncbi:3434_t:CDS:2 [Funneliformis geosporum]|nr:3434_t:CDS:2 [Funneliformis geosporum]